MKIKLLFWVLVFAPLASFAAEFTPYESDENDFMETIISLANWRDEDSGNEVSDDYYDYMVEHAEECGTCAGKYGDEFDECLSEVYEAGVLPVYDTDGTTVLYYEFPGCTDPTCPLHHTGGWAKDGSGISDVTRAPDSVLDPEDYPDKPKLPVGDPLSLAVFASLYAYVRRKK